MALVARSGARGGGSGHGWGSLRGHAAGHGSQTLAHGAHLGGQGGNHARHEVRGGGLGVETHGAGTVSAGMYVGEAIGAPLRASAGAYSSATRGVATLALVAARRAAASSCGVEPSALRVRWTGHVCNRPRVFVPQTFPAHCFLWVAIPPVPPAAAYTIDLRDRPPPPPRSPSKWARRAIAPPATASSTAHTATTVRTDRSAARAATTIPLRGRRK